MIGPPILFESGLQMVLSPQLAQVPFEFCGHLLGIDSGDFSFILKINQFAKIVHARTPGDPIGNEY